MGLGAGRFLLVRSGATGEARSVLRQMIAEAASPPAPAGRGDRRVADEIAAVRAAFMAKWQALLEEDGSPISPYRVVAELMRAVDRTRTVVTHDAGHPRDQVLPFYESIVPHGYVGWGKTTQLGTGLGLMIGAKLARPDWLAVNIMGEAAFGMVGMDFETAVRCGLPVLTIVFRNGIMGGYGRYMPIATERYQANRLSGDYAPIAAGLGGHAECVAAAADLAPALARAVAAAERGQAAMLEIVTHEEGRLPGL